MAKLGYIQVTRRCNQRCRFCSNPENGRELPLESACRLIDRYRRLGYDGVILTGGEPTVYEPLPLLIAYAAARGIHCRVITNAQRMAQPAYLETLCAAGLRHVHVSVHSHRKKVQDFLAGTPGSFDNIVRTLVYLSGKDLSVDINQTICAQNADHIDESVHWLCERFPKIRHFSWTYLDPLTDRVAEHPDTIPAYRDTKDSLLSAMRCLDATGRTFRIEKVPLCFMGEFRYCSTETRAIVKREEHGIDFLDERGHHTGTHWYQGYGKAETCRGCSVESICAGLFDLGGAYDPKELVAQKDGAAAAIARIAKDEPGRLTDAFGSTLEPRELLAGLEGRLRDDFRLIIEDDRAVIEVDGGNLRADKTEHALAWLRDHVLGMPVEVRARTEEPRARFEDGRTIPVRTVALAELADVSGFSDEVLNSLLERVGFRKLAQPAAGGTPFDRVLPAFGLCASQTQRHDLDSGPLEPFTDVSGPFFLSWSRPESASGRAGAFVAAARGLEELRWLADQLDGDENPAPENYRVLLDGLEWAVSRRPTVAAPEKKVVNVSPELCDECGLCSRVCPVGCLKSNGTFKFKKEEACLRCWDCVEACPRDALRPGFSRASSLRGERAALHPGWLSRLRGKPGPLLPASRPPSYLLPKEKSAKKPRYVLGLAVCTMQEHAATLLREGVVVGAIEEEKLVRVRHYGWPRPGGDPYSLLIEEAFCRRAIRGLLAQEGITLDDVDVIAVNGLPARYWLAFAEKADEPLPVLRAGRLMCIPHHLCHAASAFRLSGMKDAWILTVDGRGERQTAALWLAKDGRIERVYELLSVMWRSIGGVYESVTRLLGFGTHGQGIVMALAALGKPTVDLSEYLRWKSPADLAVSELIDPDLRRLSRAENGRVAQKHRDFAASLQKALEDAVLGLLRFFVPKKPRGLCLAGGVALNCQLNEKIRRALRPVKMFVQPGANDGGTALGAALEAWASFGGKSAPMEHAYLGPAFSEGEIQAALERRPVAVRRTDDLCKEAAELIASGKVVGWFQGRLEFGPRALGARSILADPRARGMKDRLNKIKQREPWRPFGPSILAGREAEWFSEAFDSRFMLFSAAVGKEKAGLIPAVLHADGTTRPQSVHREHNPLYHGLITAFAELTGVPMVVNTSFNRKGEPIVCTPSDAAAAFLDMDLDALVIGPFIVTKSARTSVPAINDESLAALSGGWRLLLRLTTECDSACLHCTMADLRGLPARSFESAVSALAAGRRAGCDELVLLRGEPALWPRLADLIERARAMGYRFVQVQTNGRAFGRPEGRTALLGAIDAAEVTFLAADEAVYDLLAGAPGAFRETLRGVKHLVSAGKDVLASVPVVRANLARLSKVPVLLQGLGVRRVQFVFPRPVETPDGVRASALVRLTEAAAGVREAARAAAKLGLSVSTEGLPWCLLPKELREGTESAAQWDRFRVDDLTSVRDEFGSQIRAGRPEPPACRKCAARGDCPRTWAVYLELVGSGELRSQR